MTKFFVIMAFVFVMTIVAMIAFPEASNIERLTLVMVSAVGLNAEVRK